MHGDRFIGKAVTVREGAVPPVGKLCLKPKTVNNTIVNLLLSNLGRLRFFYRQPKGKGAEGMADSGS